MVAVAVRDSPMASTGAFRLALRFRREPQRASRRVGQAPVSPIETMAARLLSWRKLAAAAGMATNPRHLTP